MDSLPALVADYVKRAGGISWADFKLLSAPYTTPEEAAKLLARIESQVPKEEPKHSKQKLTLA